MNAERERLASDYAAWTRWGPYLSERAWGTVREDYSPGGGAWDYFPHDHARSRAYRWNEDGLAGISDDQQRLCFALALWNGRDPILKERLFGLAGSEGNHGEDVKEYYFYLDSTPSHSYMKMLYKYPQREFPYADLVSTNRHRSRQEPEYELVDTGVLSENRYFDVFVEYAKASPEDILIRIRAINRGPVAAVLHLLPTLWFRNAWSWGDDHDPLPKPELRLEAVRPADAVGPARRSGVIADHPTLGRYQLACEGSPQFLFTENETNFQRLFGSPNSSRYVKDGIGDVVVHGRADAVNAQSIGTKAAAHYLAHVEAHRDCIVRLRLSRVSPPNSETRGETVLAESPRPYGTFGPDPFSDFDAIVMQRQSEANAFYEELQSSASPDERLVQRQAFGGLLWSKQFYHYDVQSWLNGDPGQPSPPDERKNGRNREWRHLNAADILSMPDKWEYPWFASWDLAFHCIPLALVDSEFAKKQLVMLGREWYQHPNGQVPAYEWSFGDVNPPVLAWAAWRVYKIESKSRGAGDLRFLERVFHKLLLNFTWWVNRKDSEGSNIFEGGFLGLDNIGVFDRSAMLPTGGRIEQSDGTAWMGMFCLNMLTIALELARHDSAYEDIATKFFEHFLYIAEAMNTMVGEGLGLWDEEDEFFYDVLHIGGHASLRLKVRSMVGLIPLFAVTTVEPVVLEQLPGFAKRMGWFLEHRPNLARLVSRWQEPGMKERRLLAILRGHRMKRVLRRMLDESEFLSPYGVRALSRYHLDHPYALGAMGMQYSVEYQPAESTSGLFGGNSNWRGPVWFPVNYLIVESLQQFHHYYGDDFKVECPTGSGQLLTLNEIADELSRRLIRVFTRDANGQRPIFGGQELFQHDPNWCDYIPFHEYMNGDTGAGLGASHQTGWTALVAKLIQQQGEQTARRGG